MVPMIDFILEYRYPIAVLFSIISAFHDSRYSRIMARLPMFTLTGNLRFQAKLAKFAVGGYLLYLYGDTTGDWVFVTIFPLMHLVVFDFSHLLFWRGIVEEFKWYWENCIIIRGYQWIRGFIK